MIKKKISNNFRLIRGQPVFYGTVHLTFREIGFWGETGQTAVRDLVLHGIVSQSNRPSIINGVRFYDCRSNINCRLSRSKKASNINFT